MIRKRSKHAPPRARIWRAILRRLRQIGLYIEPFFTVRESLQDNSASETPEGFRFGFLDESEFEALAAFERTEDRTTLRNWIADGKRCYAAWCKDKLAATMWCDFQEFNFLPQYRSLEADEVYLFAAYAHPDYRGMSLAPSLRKSCYRALRDMGYVRFYSYTEFFNGAARKFKQKLGARNEQLRLHVCLFDRWCRTYTLREYPANTDDKKAQQDHLTVHGQTQIASDNVPRPADPANLHHPQ